MKKLLILVFAMLVSASLFAQEVAPSKTRYALGAKKMQAGINAGFSMLSSDAVDVTSFGLGQASPFMSFNNTGAGLNFSYGITDEMHVTLALPVFDMKNTSMDKVEVLGVTMGGDTSESKMFGSPYLGFTYSKSMGKFGITATPYLALPFMEIYGGDADGDANFKQAINFGATLIFGSENSQLLWDVVVNFNMGLENDDYAKTMTLAFGLFGGYQLNAMSYVKAGLMYHAPDFEGDGEFMDGTYNLHVLYGMMFNDKMGIDAGLSYGLPIKALEEVTALGLNVAFKMNF
ncbi:hypothetical protein JXR93_02370 [bacterium]|nr:hypothetical protein [bacterium]